MFAARTFVGAAAAMTRCWLRGLPRTAAAATANSCNCRAAVDAAFVTRAEKGRAERPARKRRRPATRAGLDSAGRAAFYSVVLRSILSRKKTLLPVATGTDACHVSVVLAMSRVWVVAVDQVERLVEYCTV